MVVGLFDIDGEDIFIGHGGNQFEELLGIGTYDDLVRDTDIFLEFVGIEDDIDKDGMGFGVEIDDLHPLFGEGDGDIGQDILDRSDHVTDGLNLETLDGQNIIFLVHL